ncbi:unnamed protein product, partial [marine sediment metagenome]
MCDAEGIDQPAWSELTSPEEAYDFGTSADTPS